LQIAICGQVLEKLFNFVEEKCYSVEGCKYDIPDGGYSRSRSIQGSKKLTRKSYE
jgi:hypothetical protein